MTIRILEIILMVIGAVGIADVLLFKGSIGVRLSKYLGIIK